MKKMKTWLARGISLCVLFCMVSTVACQGMDDVVPENYGRWDNNYVYRGNGRSKTTGEDYEKLVDSVEINGETYTALACADCEIKGDDMYMILACQEAWKNPPATQYQKEVWEKNFDLTYCLVVYNIADKTQKLLTTDMVFEEGFCTYYYRLTDVEVVLDEAVVLHGVRADDERFSSNESVWYAVDLEGNMLNPRLENGEEWQYYNWVSDEYLLGEVYNPNTQLCELSYRKGDFSEPVTMFTYYGRYSDDFSWVYVEENGVQGVLFKSYYRTTDRNISYDWVLEDIQFYNFATNKKSEISINQRGDFFGNNTYLKTYDYKTKEYREFLWEKKTADVETNNAIYRIVYEESGIRLEEFFDLTEKHNYNFYGILEDKIVYRESWYEDARGCDFGGQEYVYYEQDLVSGRKTEIDSDTATALEDEYSAMYQKEKGIAVGDYVYFLHKEKLSALMSITRYAYLLKRVNTSTDRVEVMQCWHEDKNYESGGLVLKYCEELWFSCGSDHNRVFDFYEFTVRSY